MKRRAFFGLLFGSAAASLLPKMPVPKRVLPTGSGYTTKGFFRETFMAAHQPFRPEFGYVIRHLRCKI